MSAFKYADESIRSKDIMIAVPSMVIGVGILELPARLAESTRFADGWLSILIGGILAVVITWMIAKLAAKFPKQSFLTYSSSLLSKPVAYLLTFLFALDGMMIVAYQVMSISIVSHDYLFVNTPIEVIALAFLLVVVYAVHGLRTGIFRLNTMFLPIIFSVTLLLIIFSISFMELENILPVFTTDRSGYVKGVMDSAFAYSGFGILFFYVSLVKNPKGTAWRAAAGMSSVVFLYIIIYLTCIAVFRDAATEVIRYPFLELSKSVEIPGGFFERMESIFFVIWMTAIFTTAMMAFDVTVMALQSIFSNTNKFTFIVFLSPLIFLIAIFPNDFLEYLKFGKFLSYSTWGLSSFAVIILWMMYAFKGGRGRGKN